MINFFLFTFIFQNKVSKKYTLVKNSTKNVHFTKKK
jgi:hypothetical protein